VSTGGTLTLGAAGVAGRPANEHDRLGEGPRVDAENAVIAMAETGVRSSVVRLSPLVHSSLDHHGFAPILIRVAREKGISGYVGEGSNRWPAVHTLDAARLYRLALESATAGSILHGVADEGVPFREIAESIARKLSVPSVSVAPGDAFEHFGFLGAFAAVDNPVSSALTREWLNWKPAHAGLIADLEEDHYFAAVAA
jgi:nucleoside-diphosphate-sugar epimerase